MNSTKATARQAGVVYFIFMIIAIIGEFVLPAYVVPGNAAATAAKIASGTLAYRIDILVGFLTHILFVFLVVTLHKLLKGVDSGHAMLMVLLVALGIAASLANMLLKLAPLVLLSGADYLSVFTKPQLDAMALSALRLHGSGTAIPTAFWGLWLFPFGILVIRSGFLPRLLGVLLLVAGAAYVASSVTSIAFPEHRQLMSRILMPLYFGEVPIIFWLLIMGAKDPVAKAPAPQAG